MQHTFWHQVPMVRALLPFACGIGISMFYSIPFIAALCATIACLLLAICSSFWFKAYQQRWYSGLFLSAAFLCFGVLLHLFQHPLRSPQHYSKAVDAITYLVKVDEEPVVKSHSYKMRTCVLQIENKQHQSVPVTGYLLLYLNKSEQTTLPRYGQLLLIPADRIREVPPPKNPFEFDYKRYLAFHYIYYQAYLKSREYKVLQAFEGAKVMELIYSIQHYFKQVLQTYVKGTSEVGVAQALVYGFDDEIDEETMSAYANTGTLHVLAVSGMHVGIILYILNGLLFFMNKNKRLLLVKQVLLLVCIWVYSALCGLSPSILRATVMFSFILISKMLDRRSNVYNTLAASCFTLLCMDANMLANVGFQLSYMAVLGIVFIQPLIYPWFVSTNWLVDQIWKITSVSIAAQLATSPIGLLYFHQFPNCFLFSNLLIIPLTTVILYACLILLVVSCWPLIAAYLGLGIKYTIAFTNWLVAQVEHIPYAYVNGIEISIPQTILLYLFLFSVIYYFLYQYTSLFKLALLALFCFVCIVSYQSWQQKQQQVVVVYSINKATAIGMISGKQSVYLLDSTMRNDKQKFRFHVQQHVWQKGITQLDTLYAENNWHELSLGNKRIVVSGKQRARINSPDLLVVRYPLKEEDLLAIQPKQIVINGSLGMKKSEQLLQLCNKHHIPAHVVLNSGAFELSL